VRPFHVRGLAETHTGSLSRTAPGDSGGTGPCSDGIENKTVEMKNGLDSRTAEHRARDLAGTEAILSTPEKVSWSPTTMRPPRWRATAINGELHAFDNPGIWSARMTDGALRLGRTRARGLGHQLDALEGMSNTEELATAWDSLLQLLEIHTSSAEAPLHPGAGPSRRGGLAQRRGPQPGPRRRPRGARSCRRDLRLRAGPADRSTTGGRSPARARHRHATSRYVTSRHVTSRPQRRLEACAEVPCRPSDTDMNPTAPEPWGSYGLRGYLRTCKPPGPTHLSHRPRRWWCIQPAPRTR
jgi:hypothetical protein